MHSNTLILLVFLSRKRVDLLAHTNGGYLGNYTKDGKLSINEKLLSSFDREERKELKRSQIKDKVFMFEDLKTLLIFYDLKVELDSDEVKYCVKKGSVAVNGISLTIADIEKNTVMIALIPHTYENTNLKYLKNGSFVNIETDILSKYVEKFLLTRDNKSGIDLEFLQRNGF